MRNHSCPLLVACLLFMLNVLVYPSVRTVQSKDKPNPKRAEFGSSLKKLEWDPHKRMAVEKEPWPASESEQAASEDVIKLETTLAVFPVAVTDDKGRPVPGLQKEDFVVTEDGVPQQIAVFTLGDDARRPRSIVLLLEWSNTAHYVRESLKAAEQFVSHLAPEDKVAIVTGNLKLVCDFTRDKAEVAARLRDLREKARRGQRGLPAEQFEFTTLFAALREMIDEETEQPIIVFQGDGGEAIFLRDQIYADRPVSPSRKRTIGLTDFDAVIERKRATIYPVLAYYHCFDKEMSEAEHMQMILQAMRKHGFSKPIVPIRQIIEWDRITRQAVKRVAGLSGGFVSCLDSPDKAPAVYSQILAAINQRYVLGYYPTNRARDGKRRRVHIQVRHHAEYLVEGRSHYYAPTQNPARR